MPLLALATTVRVVSWRPILQGAPRVFQMEEESARFMAERSQHNKDMSTRQGCVIDTFDEQSATMGLDSLHIVEATQDSYSDDDDADSVGGSMLSLTPSASSNSFSHSAL